MTIYIEEILLENFILNLIILYATGLISKSNMKALNLIFGSLIGAIYTIIYYIIPNKLYSSILIKFTLSIIMIFTSFKPKSFKHMLKTLVFFYLVSFAFGGAALCTIYIMDTKKITIQDGIIVGDYTLKTILIGVIIAFVIIIFAFKFVKKKFSRKDLICNIEIKIAQKSIKTKALLDTGNLLKEPITNLPVIVVEQSILEGIIPSEILKNTQNILGGDLTEIPKGIQEEYMSKFKVIPFTSLGKQNGILLGLKADGVIVEEDDVQKQIEKIMIGIYNKKLSKKGEYQALIGMDIM